MRAASASVRPAAQVVSKPPSMAHVGFELSQGSMSDPVPRDEPPTLEELLGLPPQSDDCWTGLCQQQQRDEGRPVDRHSLRTPHAIACLVYKVGVGFV